MSIFLTCTIDVPETHYPDHRYLPTATASEMHNLVLVSGFERGYLTTATGIGALFAVERNPDASMIHSDITWKPLGSEKSMVRSIKRLHDSACPSQRTNKFALVPVTRYLTYNGEHRSKRKAIGAFDNEPCVDTHCDYTS